MALTLKTKTYPLIMTDICAMFDEDALNGLVSIVLFKRFEAHTHTLSIVIPPLKRFVWDSSQPLGYMYNHGSRS